MARRKENSILPSIEEHTKAVLSLSLYLGNYLVKGGIDKNAFLCDLCTTVICHDIGKCVEVEHKKSDTYHNVVSWAFFVAMVHNGNNEANAFIASSILHHHPSKDEELSNICSTLSDDDWAKMRSFYSEMCNYAKEAYGIDALSQYALNGKPSIIKTRTSNYCIFNTIDDKMRSWRKVMENDSKSMLLDACLVYADSYASSLGDKEILQSIIANNMELLHHITIGSITNVKYGPELNNIRELPKLLNGESLDTDRFHEQCEAIEALNSAKESAMIVSATAGYGKTMLGLLWLLSNGKRGIWVAPTNAIVESTYISVMDELSRFHIENDVKVAAYYGGEYKIGEEDADIIITNIDSILYRYIRDERRCSLANLYLDNMIFDEYHMHLSEDPLFAGFIRLIYARKNLTSSKTLLLSGSPHDFACLWGTENIGMFNKSLTLNNEMKVNISVTHIQDPSEIKAENDSFVILPSVAMAQKAFKENRGHKVNLIHARFTNNDRRLMFKKLFAMNGKRSEVSKHGIWYGTSLIGTALDVSAKHIYDCVLSPEDTVQRGCGRGGRFNEVEYNGEVFYHACILNGALANALQFNVSPRIYKEWVNLLEFYNGKQLTKGELYEKRREFYASHKADATEWYTKMFLKSNNTLAETYITRPKPIDKSKYGQHISKTNAMRGTTETNIFVSSPYEGNYIEPIVVNSCFTNEGTDDQFYKRQREEYISHCINEISEKRGPEQAAKMKKYIKYKLKMKKTEDFTVEACKRLAYNSDTPLLLCKASYDQTVGLEVNA